MAKILFITNDFGPRAGGIESFIIGLIERLPKGSVTVYTSSQKESELYDATWREEFQVEVLRDRQKILLPTLRVGRAVAEIARELQVEVVCFGAAAPLAILAPFLRRAGVKKIIALTHGHEVWWAKVFPFSLAMRIIGEKIDALTYLGEFTRAAIGSALSPTAKMRMRQVAPGIDITHFSPSADSEKLRLKLGLQGVPVIVSVGRLVHRKGQDRLIQALPEIQRAVPGAHLLLVGEGPYKKKLHKIIHQVGMNDSVTFIGRVKYAELPSYFGVGDIFAMPSRSRFRGLEVEGLGIVYLEASACGLPVIAGNSGGAPDAVIAGVTGLVIDGNSPSAIAAAAISLLGNPQEISTMGAAGREWVRKEWSWETRAEVFGELLKIK